MADLKVTNVNPQYTRGKGGERELTGGSARLEGTDADGRKVTATVKFETKDAAKYVLGASITL